MKAWRINELGHPATALTLEDVAMPEPGSGEVRIRVEAGNINFADILLCQGIYQVRPQVPFTPGLETAGIVDAVGAGVNNDLVAGARIAGMSALPCGGYAQYALIQASSAVVVPDDIPASAATVLYSTFQTSHVALHHRAQLQTNEWVLIHGASSGVGAAAVQLAAAAGAKVIATAGSDAKRAHCTDLGADHVLDSRGDDIYDQVMALTDGRGVDVAFDPVGGDLGEVTRRLMGWEGRLLVIGFASGGVPSYPANHVLVKNYTVIGVHWGAYNDRGGRSVVESAHQDLIRLYRNGSIQADVSESVDLDDLPGALAALEARQVTGRLVLSPT